MAIAKRTFTNANLDGSYRLVWNHNLNTTDVIPTLYDNDLIQGITSDLFALGDETGADKPNNITLSMGGPITGTFTLLLSYISAGESGAGRRAFELSTTATPTDDMRVIIGKEATPSLNMTLTQFFAHLLTKLGFLKLAENLNDIVNKEQARTNLGVYSTVEVDNGLSAKASLYQAGSGAVLGVANTAAFNPTSTYHPATKKYADDYILFHGMVTATSNGAQTVTKYSGVLTVTCDHEPQEGKFKITHNKGDLNYVIFHSIAGDYEKVVYAVYDKQINTVKVSVFQNTNFYITIFRI